MGAPHSGGALSLCRMSTTRRGTLVPTGAALLGGGWLGRAIPAVVVEHSVPTVQQSFRPIPLHHRLLHFAVEAASEDPQPLGNKAGQLSRRV